MSVSLECIEECFSIFDTDRDGKIARETVPDVLRAIGKAPTQEEVKKLLEQCKEFVTLDQFKNLYRTNSSIRSPDKLEEDMLNCFRACDREGTGQIHEAELRQTLTTLGDCLTPSEVDALLKDVTIGSNGMIDYDKFVQMLIQAYPVDD